MNKNELHFMHWYTKTYNSRTTQNVYILEKQVYKITYNLSSYITIIFVILKEYSKYEYTHSCCALCSKCNTENDLAFLVWFLIFSSALCVFTLQLNYHEWWISEYRYCKGSGPHQSSRNGCHHILHCFINCTKSIIQHVPHAVYNAEDVTVLRVVPLAVGKRDW
jgi:hypothetical protein